MTQPVTLPLKSRIKSTLPSHDLLPNILDIRYDPLISWPPTNQLTSPVNITLQQSAPSSHEYAELQAIGEEGVGPHYDKTIVHGCPQFS